MHIADLQIMRQFQVVCKLNGMSACNVSITNVSIIDRRSQKKFSLTQRIWRSSWRGHYPVPTCRRWILLGHLRWLQFQSVMQFKVSNCEFKGVWDKISLSLLREKIMCLMLLVSSISEKSGSQISWTLKGRSEWKYCVRSSSYHCLNNTDYMSSQFFHCSWF